MVGRFVQQQHVRLGRQCTGQCHAFFPATGQFADQGVGLQVQVGEGGGDQRIKLPAITCFQCVLQRFHACQRGFMIGIRLGQLLGNLMVFAEQGFQFAQSAGNRVKNGVVRVEFRLLCHVGHAHIALDVDAPVVQRDGARNALEQGRLAGTIAANQANHFARLQREIDIIQQSVMAKSQAGLFNRNQ